MTWFKKKDRPRRPEEGEERTVRTEGLFVKCPGCEEMLLKREMEENFSVCPRCGHHRRIGAAERLKMTLDEGEWTELDSGLSSTDPLTFMDTKSYRARLRQMQSAEATITITVPLIEAEMIWPSKTEGSTNSNNEVMLTPFLSGFFD